MWLIVMFDLPVKTKQERKTARLFHKQLVVNGFEMIQYSVYGNYCEDRDELKKKRKAIVRAMPLTGNIRLLTVPDFHYLRMEQFSHTRQIKTEKPEQILFF
ncbi:MAG: CRISPR-associated endonuclease Cas2 [Planctomycetia bacterium]|nr:CRISPR-associated endonuclease Cas2 [Planctomycetia bacterium]